MLPDKDRREKSWTGGREGELGQGAVTDRGETDWEPIREALGAGGDLTRSLVGENWDMKPGWKGEETHWMRSPGQEELGLARQADWDQIGWWWSGTGIQMGSPKKDP